ncbi:MAG: UvrD-helicase domain-containing protein, partial [Spirochaetia bacterium]|nr:UvrD-helicase domain-containing protein [Spirochaetia bacterium]
MSPNSLNPEQKSAVDIIHGPLLIFAGAGSGKTRVITHRIQNMVKSGIPGSSIVAVTFTNKSAKEMKSRMSKMMDRKQLRGMVISTFHSLGNRILKSEIHRLPGYRIPFSIITADDARQFLSDIYRKLKMDPASLKDDGMEFLISLCKNSGISAEDFAMSRGLPCDSETFIEIFRLYQESLQSFNSVDFDDLILLPQKLFKENPDLVEKYRNKYKYFLVDEFQDTNPSQYDLLRILVGDTNNICVVGDDDQSIYGWRGADVNIILGFQKDFPDAKTVRLEWNYRSTRTILDAANEVIVNNSERIDKKLRTNGETGRKINCQIAANEEQEAELVANEIQKEILKSGRTPGDFAILYRTNFQSRVFEQELRKRSIPHHVVGGYRFFDRREVKDMISYLRAIANPKDEVSIKRIINRPRRGIGEGTIKKINEYITEHHHEEDAPDFHKTLERMMETPALIPGIKSDTIASILSFMELIEKYRKEFKRSERMSPVLSSLIHELGFENEFLREGDNDNVVKARMLNLSELVNMLSFMESNWEDSNPPTLFDFMTQIGLQATDNEEDNPRGRVQLLTMHLSKGLEFPVVFLVGMEE